MHRLNQFFLDTLHKNPIEDFEIPHFNYESMQSRTKEEPSWLHFGISNIFRGFIAGLQQELLNSGIEDKGIIAVETYDPDIVYKVSIPHDSWSIDVIMHENGFLEKRLVASVAETIVDVVEKKEAWERLKEIFRAPSLQMVSYTITEKGYSIYDIKGAYLPQIADDIQMGREHPTHIMSLLTALLYERFLTHAMPIAVVSMDNCSCNGKKIQEAVATIAKEWIAKHDMRVEFLDYLMDATRVSFPWTMIDKITPRPSEFVKQHLESLGWEDMDILCTEKNTYIAPFVNSEKPQYLAIEDSFPNGRPQLEQAGTYLVDRDTVNKIERMKVTTCLNPLHTALSIFGCLLGYTSIAKEMENPLLKDLIENIVYKEGMPVLEDPVVLDPYDFAAEVLEHRFTNAFIPDTPQRIMTDTSQKIPIRFGETMKAYDESDDLEIGDLCYIPLVIAGWCRYLMALDDNGEKMQLSPDPYNAKLQDVLKSVVLGDKSTYQGQLHEILCDPVLMGLNLYKTPLADKIEKLFLELIEGKGAVTAVLKRYCGEEDA